MWALEGGTRKLHVALIILIIIKSVKNRSFPLHACLLTILAPAHTGVELVYKSIKISYISVVDQRNYRHRLRATSGGRGSRPSSGGNLTPFLLKSLHWLTVNTSTQP